MNTTLATPSRHEHPVHREQRPQVRRVGLLDRAALHLGVALIKWGRRPGLAAQERRATRLERVLLRNAIDERIESHRAQVLRDYSIQLRLR